MAGKEVEIETGMEIFSLKNKTKAYIRWESLNRQSFIEYF